MTNTVCTLFELISGDDTKSQGNCNIHKMITIFFLLQIGLVYVFNGVCLMFNNYRISRSGQSNAAKKSGSIATPAKGRTDINRWQCCVWSEVFLMFYLLCTHWCFVPLHGKLLLWYIVADVLTVCV
jgi:hypothetical protein